jgi:hypothetical protein
MAYISFKISAFVVGFNVLFSHAVLVELRTLVWFVV